MNKMEPKYIRLPSTLFTSVEPFINSSDYFPSHDRRIGITIRAGYHPDYRRVMVEIDEERPSFVATSRGEYIDVGESQDKIKQRLDELADYCLTVARELQEHADRLKLASKQVEIDIESVESISKVENKNRDKVYVDESRPHAYSKRHAMVSPPRPASRPKSVSTPLATDLFK